MEKANLEPRTVRFEPVVLMSRLRVKLRMRLRTDELLKSETEHLPHSFPHPWQVDDVACELTDVGELSLLTSRPGWSCSE